MDRNFGCGKATGFRHGFIRPRRAVHGKGLITAFQNYLADVVEQVKRFRSQGLTAEQTARKVDMTSHRKEFPQIQGPGIEVIGAKRFTSGWTSRQNRRNSLKFATSQKRNRHSACGWSCWGCGCHRTTTHGSLRKAPCLKNPSTGHRKNCKVYPLRTHPSLIPFGSHATVRATGMFFENPERSLKDRKVGSPGNIRTCNPSVNSRMLYH